ncbi:Helix-turn-helix [Moraxella cuniculi DSM 21768]|uniref:Helix-turn-helix n=2 Tax=Moraxella cuniculi TaxID=34061 RepID=A0A1N7D7X2_9GAMM|nr:Helix-turn-helix [Moraxella cuniculi DSM 21768]
MYFGCNFAPKTGSFYHTPKIGAMKNLRLSIHSPENIWLRQLLIKRRRELKLSQRELAERLDVVYSFVGKVETGDRRLDFLEFIAYCHSLEIDPCQVVMQFNRQFS